MDPDSYSTGDAGQEAGRTGSPAEDSPARAGGDPPLETRLREALAPALDVKERIGGGARVQVYRAREVDLGRYVAVKVLLPEARDEVAGQRFEREAKAVAVLSHPNVVDVYRYGRLPDGTPYMVMQYVKGRSLAERLKAEGPLPAGEVRRILADVASALAAAHRRGIVHRNVRPSKVLYEEETGRVLLSDFGIAAILATEEEPDAPRLTQPGQLLGDPRYMSPERLEGAGLTARADVYSLGILGYELLTGHGPYGERPAAQLVAAHIQEDPQPLATRRPDADPGLADLLKRCLAKEPSHRPDAAYVHRSLTEPAGGGGTGAAETSSLFQALLGRRVPQYVGAAVAGAVGLVGLVSELAGNGILPLITVHLALVLSAFGLVAVGVVSWFHGERGHQEAPLAERVILALLAVGWLGASALVLLS